MLELKAEKRTDIGKLERLRAMGKMPAVFYGGKERSTPISILSRDFERIWKQAGESTVISLSGIGDTKEVLIHDVDLDPVSEEPRHADFFVLEKGKKVQIEVPLEFIGIAPAVKELSGTLVKVLHEIEIDVIPKDLPKSIEVDVSSLTDFSSRIFVKDLKLPGDSKLITGGEEVVALVSEVVEEKEEAPVEAPDLSTIEVEKRGKEEKEGEEGEVSEAPKKKEENK
jgi:large subunit ribosomal protein L25